MSTNRSFKLVAAAAIGVCVVALGTLAIAATADVIKERQQGLKKMGEDFKAMTDQMRAGKLDPATVKQASATISKTADTMPHWFPKGSGPEAGVKTAAKPEIWTDNDTFVAAQKKLVEEAGKFAQVANGGDMTAVGPAVRGLGGACKNCHDKFRVKED